MAQRPRLSQIRRADTNFRTFDEQFKELERETRHGREPVTTVGELPQIDNRDGDLCLVLNDDVIYRWKEQVQNWTPVLGKGYDVPSGTIKRYRGKYVATGGETIVSLSHRYDVGVNTLDVFVQGILQDEGIDYYEVDEVTIEFTTPLEAGMEVTYMTPYVVGDVSSVVNLEKRLESIEHNHYQLMMNQYYTGKPVQAQGLAFDGFLNTNQIDYLLTSNNIEYVSVDRIMKLKTNTSSQFQEAFDSTAYTDPISTVWMRGSEITLPLNSVVSTVLQDNFADDTKINIPASSAFHDLGKQLFTTDDTYAGGNHYYKGDFMGTTGNADRSSNYTWGSNVSSCYSVIAQGNMISSVNDTNILYTDVYPYAGASYHYTRGSGSYGDNDGLGELYYFGEDLNRYFNVYVKSTNRIYTLKQAAAGSNKWRQQIFTFNGRSRDLGSYTSPAWPTGMPNTTGYNLATDWIDQMGSDETHIIFRIGNKVYFVDVNTWTVDRLIDFTDAVRKPSLYIQNSRQFTADARYLYFPARLYRDSLWGYYLEVFDKVTGEYINEILVTRDNTGQPSTTAMHYDQWNNRMVLGLWGGAWYSLAGKSFYSYNSSTGYAGFFVLDIPKTSFVALQSKAITTNLPTITYKLQATEVLSGGVSEYYIRFGQNPWQKINLNQEYTYTNPLGAKETTIELRALLRTNIGTATAPTLTDWTLSIKTFKNSALYQSKEQLMSLNNVTGGRLIQTGTIPNETSLNWEVKLDTADPYIAISDDGHFSTMSGMDLAHMTLKGTMATNNPLLSPVVKDITLQMHYVDAGQLVSNTFQQIEDINEATMWVTTGSSSDYYVPHLSRDGGDTWIEGIKEDTLRMQDGTVESKFHFVFDGTEQTRQKLKVKFEITGTTEFRQYGVMLNPS